MAAASRNSAPANVRDPDCAGRCAFLDAGFGEFCSGRDDEMQAHQSRPRDRFQPVYSNLAQPMAVPLGWTLLSSSNHMPCPRADSRGEPGRTPA